MSYLLGIDIGTSSTKTVLFNVAGEVITSAADFYPMEQPKNGWAEQDPGDWWNAAATTIREVVAKAGINPKDIKGIGLSGQMHGLVMLGKDNKPVRKSIIWCDQRTALECEQITSLVGADKLIEITANPALTGFTASKIMWVKNNQPEIYDKCRKILLPKDYIRFKLTGEFATEVSDASGMQLLDVPKRQWSNYVLEKLDINQDLLGRLYESVEVTGTVTKEAAEACGLCEGIPVVGGAGDQAASAIGNGIVKEGVISATIGTSGVVFAHLDKPAIDKLGRAHTFCHAVPGAWHVMGVTQSAGLSYKWFRDNFMTSEKFTAEQLNTDPNILIDKIAGSVPAGSNGLIYLPYLMGERTPHLDADCRGVFFGLSGMHEKKDLLRAVMEGVVFSMNDCLGIIREMGTSPNYIYAAGGGANSPLWRQMMADIMQTEIAVNNSSESGALGVAILAGVGSGVYKDVVSACSNIIKRRDSQICSDKNKNLYEEMYKIYMNLYKSLKKDFASLAKINQKFFV
ncbi:MAG: xylulokinase [Oscillospiraceae bacterium]|nr:xylulokinase [Oscillospiraceae bacterium]